MANEKEIFLSIKRLNKRFESNFNSKLEEFNLTSRQGMALLFINRRVNVCHQIVHQNDVEKEFNLTKSTVSDLINRLEKKELIKKVNKSPYVELYPTEKGIELTRHFRNNWELYLDKLLYGFSEEEKKELLDVLIKLNENIKEDK